MSPKRPTVADQSGSPYIDAPPPWSAAQYAAHTLANRLEFTEWRVGPHEQFLIQVLQYRPSRATYDPQTGEKKHNGKKRKVAFRILRETSGATLYDSEGWLSPSTYEQRLAALTAELAQWPA